MTSHSIRGWAGRRRVLRLTLAAALAVVALIAAPGKAEAGRYRLDACDVPGHRVLDRGPWNTYEQSSNGTFVDTCGGSPARFGVRDGGESFSGEIGWKLEAPTGIGIREVRYWYGIDHGSASNGLVTFPIGCSSLRSCSSSSEGDSYEYPAGTNEVSFGMRCAASCNTGDSAEFLVYGVRTTLEEFLIPTASITGGSALAEDALRGTRSLAFDASDAQSGIERVEAYLDGVLAGQRSFAGECTWDNWNACPKAQSATLAIDTTVVDDGTATLELVVIDAAGNERHVVPAEQLRIDNVLPPAASGRPAIAGTPRVGNELSVVPGSWTGEGLALAFRWERCDESGCQAIPAETGSSYRLRDADAGRRIRVAVIATNAEGATEALSDPVGPVAAAVVPAAKSPLSGPSQPAAPNGSNASDRATVRAWIGSARKRSIRTRYTSRNALRGTVTDERGRPVEGALVTIHERVGTSEYRPAGQARTGEGGRYTWRTSRAPSRLLKVGYASRAGAAPTVFSAPVRIEVQAPVRLRANRRTRNRGWARFRGQLLGRPVPRGGVVVEMQARVGRRWRTFATTRVRRSSGRFSYRYRFVRTFRTRSYRFRARVRKQAGFPYATGASPTVRVHVRGAR